MNVDFCLKFEFFNKFCENKLIEPKMVEMFYISQDLLSQEYFGFFFANNKAYGFGNNSTGQLGFGHCNKIQDFQEICELSGQNICGIYEGNCCMFARSKENKIFSWGSNFWGQMCCGYTSPPNLYFKPVQMEIFNDKDVIDIVCSHLHNLALTSNGLVYGWGQNKYGQTGTVKNKNLVLSPIRIELQNIKFISCYINTTFFIDQNNKVYFCGENILRNSPDNDESIFKPILLEKIEASKIICNEEFKYFINSETLFSFEEYSEEHLRKKNISENVTDITFNDDFELIAQKLDKVYILENELLITEYVDFYYYYLNNYKRTFKCINIKEVNENISLKVEKGSNPLKFTPFFEPSVINHFNIFLDFPPYLCQNIITLYVSRDPLLGYCVLNDNKVYGFGEKIHQILGYNKSEEKYVLIKELCEQNIQQFYEGRYFMFARNGKNEVFSWGWNYLGQLARGIRNESDEYLIPEKISYFDRKNIIQISCGLTHCLALSSDGLIYGWGYNGFGSVGCGEREEKFILKPIPIDLKEKIKFIYCSRNMSFAVNFDGNAYYWGRIGKIYYNPIKLDKSIKIKSILSTRNYSNDLYVLSYEAIIHKLCEENKEIIFKIFCDLKIGEKKGNKIIDLCSDKNAVFLQTEDCIYVCEKSKEQKTPYKTLIEYFTTSELFVKRYIKNVHNFKQNSSLRASRDLPQLFDNNVKYFYQSEKYSNYFELLVKNDNKVYGLGYNIFGKLGLGPNERVYEYTEIIELKEKNIQEFYEGFDCMFARNDKNELFSWGKNWCGQLARGYESKFEEYLKPEKIDIFDGKNIIQLSFGYYHCLALSSDGRLYGWGSNRSGQVGCKKAKEIILTPIEIDLKEKIKFIHCSRDMSFAVSFDGNPYFWGNLIFTPKLIPLNNVIKLNYDLLDDFVILDNNGKVFKFNPLKDEIKEIKCEEKFIDLYCQDRYCLLKSEDCVYQLEVNELIKTDFIDFNDFYSQQLDFYNKTIEVTKDGYLMTKEIHLHERENILVLQNENVFQSKYQNLFDEIGQIGKGSFGNVYEVKKKSNQIHYAIKRIEIKGELDLKEIKLMKTLYSNYVVQYFDSWIEGQMVFGKIRRYLLIQMELCSMNLRQFIQFMSEIKEERFQTFIYFISCEILKEMLECINYLHSLNLPIIHRNLKPQNILISDGINGRFLKLAGLGSATFHDKSDYTRMVGTMNYMAPEVLNSNKYNTKSDIYSLAIIATEIFGFKDKDIRNHEKREDFDIKTLDSKYSDQSLKEKFKKVLDLISICLTPEDYHLRPDCKELLENFNEFSVDKSIVLNDKNISDFKSLLETKDKNLKKFFETKISVK